MSKVNLILKLSFGAVNISVTKMLVPSLETCTNSSVTKCLLSYINKLTITGYFANSVFHRT